MAQLVVFSTIVGGLLLFVWNKLRYDVTALIVLLAVIIAGFFVPGILPENQLFWGFGHEALIIVASMFILSSALIHSGVVDIFIRRLTPLDGHPVRQLGTLVILATIFSAFMNSIGAIAIIMPIAIHMAKKSNISPAMFLLPIAFASHLGGYLTLIGTPRNIIVSSFREGAGFEPFGMFDFAYVGGPVALVGIIFLVIIGAVFFKKRGVANSGELFEIKNYVVEAQVGERSKFINEYVRDLPKLIDLDFTITAVIRGTQRMTNPSDFEIVQTGDVLLIESPSDNLTDIVEMGGLTLAGRMAEEKNVTQSEEHGTVEATVPPTSLLVGRTWESVALSARFGVNLLAISREGEEIRDHLNRVTFKPDDILIFEGRKESIYETLSAMGSYPLADRSLTLGRNPRIWGTLGIFASAVVLGTLFTTPVAIIFLTAAVLMVITGILSTKQAYESINFPVLILLGAMLTLGLALETSGGAASIATLLLSFSSVVDPILLLAILLLVSMALSDFVNSTTSVVIMAPIAILVAGGIGASIDPFLMAVAIGSSSAFLSYESNATVMEAGGYTSLDNIKVGLPLEILVAVISIPAIVYFWPLF